MCLGLHIIGFILSNILHNIVHFDVGSVGMRV